LFAWYWLSITHSSFNHVLLSSIFSGEASSLAGHWGLGRLIVLYDDNKITIDGETNMSFTEDVIKRYEAYGWHTQTVHNGDENTGGIAAAIAEAKNVRDKPSLIAVKTIIGYGALLQNTQKVHGSPLGDAGLKHAKVGSTLYSFLRFLPYTM
jgi:transketolase